MASPSLSIPSELPILPIRNRVLFPGGLLRLAIGKTSTVALIREYIWEAHHYSRRKQPIYIGIFTFVQDKEAQDKSNNEENEKIEIEKDSDLFDPKYSEIYATGTLARIVQLTHSRSNQPGKFSMLVQGLKRVRVSSYIQMEPYILTRVFPCRNIGASSKELKQLSRRLREATRELLNISSQTQQDKSSIIARTRELVDAIATSSPGELAFLLISSLDAELSMKQRILHYDNVVERVEKTLELLEDQLDEYKVSKQIHTQVQERMDDKRREFYLRQQLKAIKEELGEGDEEGEEEGELDSIEEKLKTISMPENIRQNSLKELRRLKKLPTAHAEYHVLRTYLEWVVELPWVLDPMDTRKIDLDALNAQLDEDHYGLDHVKQRIMEYMAVRKLKVDSTAVKGPILCLVGPPGVGKTSLGKSIAQATGRPFQRIALGGVHDEAEIRGHRRTYIGALPGKVIHAMKNAKAKNPVILLDEVDKLGKDVRGDPSSALLEVLDPSQNSTFTDHYLNVPFDLSEVLFIATANSMDTIPRPLLDRMELISISGYTVNEKLDIAERFLLPRQLEDNGLTDQQLHIPRETLEDLIVKYTHEAGVRTLERKIGSICRSIAVQVVEWRSYHEKQIEVDRMTTQTHELKEAQKISNSQDVSDSQDAVSEDTSMDPDEALKNIPEFELVTVSVEMLTDILGNPVVHPEIALREGCAGVVTGLAWTSTGGELLFIESSRMKGTGKLHLTGKLGDVMKESAELALSWIRSHHQDLEELFMRLGTLSKIAMENVTTIGSLLRFDSNEDIHIHFPAGAIPKDGPSAGVAITISLLSMLCNEPIHPYIAMTGELSLRGVVLPVGGIKEKVIAAHRGGIRTVFLPIQNKGNVDDIPNDIQNDLSIVYVSHIMEVIEFIFSSFLCSMKNNQLSKKDQTSGLPTNETNGHVIVQTKSLNFNQDLVGPLLQCAL